MANYKKDGYITMLFTLRLSISMHVGAYGHMYCIILSYIAACIHGHHKAYKD